MFVRILGPVAAGARADDLREPPGSVPAAVLAHLALARGRVLGVEALTERIWDSPPDNPRNAVQAAVSRLRRALPGPWLETTRAGYRLATERVDVDLLLAERELREARDAASRDDLDTAIRTAGAALARFGGTPLGGIESSATDAARTTLDELRAGAVRLLADSMTATGRSSEAVALLHDEAVARPLDEGLHCSFMRALAAAGRSADALATYDALRRRLADELGVDPSSDTAAVFAAVLSGDVAANDRRPRRPGAGTVVSSPREVGILLTDVVGSAQHWLDHPQLMPAMLLAHQAVVADVVRAHDGRLPPDQGDGDARLAVFPSAGAALLAGGELQRALALGDWPGGHRLEVRAAVHVGSVVEAGGNVFGECVLRGARLRALGHGGQVLVSRAVVDLVGDRLDDGWHVTPLGRVELRDLGVEDVHQLDRSGAGRVFPPLRTSVRLPVEMDDFVGRADEVSGIVADLRTHRLVTLTGLGGSGKTRLAVRVARLGVGDRHGGVTFVDLSDTATVEQARSRVVAALGGADDGTREEAYADALVVLDNLEQLDDAAALVAAVLESTTSTVLATSRVPTGARGEHVRPVPPMGPRDALALLVDRAADAGERELSPADAQAIVELTGGLPLAVELAAARLRVLDAASLVALLRDGLDPLRDGSGARPARHDSLEALLADTWARTSADQRAVLRAVAQARAGLTASGVADVAGLDLVGALDQLAAVQEIGLVQRRRSPEAGPLFAMVELVRRFTEDRSDPRELALARAAYERQLLDAVLRGGAPEVLGRDDVRQVLVSAAGGGVRELVPGERVRLGRVALHHGWWPEAAALLEPVAQDADAANPLGLALIRRAQGSDVARGRGLLAGAAAAGDADAAAVLGGSWRAEDPEESYRWYVAALSIDPTDAYALGNVLELEARRSGLDRAVGGRREAIVTARQRRREQALAGDDLPWSWYDLAKLGLLLGDEYDALHALLDAVATTANPAHLESSRRALVAFAETGADASWRRAIDLLDIAATALNWRPKSMQDNGLRSPVIVLCGSSTTAQHDDVMAWIEPLAAALPPSGGTLVSGGTAQGVSALAAALASRSPGWVSWGYLPRDLPGGVVADESYDELRRSETSSFSLREAISYWHDLVAAGVDPREVRVVGIGGGAITALELHLAEVVGARVAVASAPVGPSASAHPARPGRTRTLARDAAELRRFLA